ncbi:MAG TPA: ADOP family duplicated permease [Vicinamibacterales bacterium]|nr:ADOP family duplicated permease [Vicinamibacterales bacterium]
MRRLIKRAFLLAYPRHLRHAYGDDILLAIGEDLKRRRGPRGRLGWFGRTIADAAASWRPRQPRPQIPLPEPGGPMSSLGSDLRSALRLFTHAPAFAAGAVLTLSLGIGATTAIFSLADASLLHPLSVPGADRIVVNNFTWSYLDFRDLARQTTSFDDTAAWTGFGGALEYRGTTHPLQGAVCSGSYTRLLGVTALAGRVLDERDDQAGAPLAIMISEGVWNRIFGRDPSVVGSTVQINRRPATVVGITPASFRGASLTLKTEVLVPLAVLPEVSAGFLARPDIFTSRTTTWLQVGGRLKAGTQVESAETETNAIYKQSHPKHDVNNPRDRYVLVPLLTRATGLDRSTDLRTFILILGGATLVTMLLACATVANLLLVRADRRERELAVRAALGAGRWRMARLMMTESVCLGVAGALGGVLVARGALSLLASFTLPGDIRVADLEFAVNRLVLFVSVGLGIATSALFGVAPLWRVSRMDVTSALRGSQGHSPRQPLRTTLVTMQVALCVMLLGGGFAFGRAVQRAFALDLGFDTQHPAIVTPRWSLLRYSRAQILDVQTRTLAAAAAAPWVEAAGFAGLRPLSGRLTMDFDVPGFTPEKIEDSDADVTPVSSGYLEAVRIPLRAGRTFTTADTETSPHVAVISEALARRFWPNGNAVGARFYPHDAAATPEQKAGSVLTVVGVVGDIRRGLERDADPMVYLPNVQFKSAFDFADAHLFVRAKTLPSEAAAKEAVALLKQVDPRLPIAAAMTMQEHIGDAAMVHRLGFTLFALFAGLAVVLTAIGVYAVVAFAVARRTREIGIRMALGARASTVLGLVLRQGAGPVVGGLVLGLAGYWLSSGALRRFLLSLPAFDGRLAAAITMMIGLIAAVALVLPLRRALRVDPMRTLRSE